MNSNGQETVLTRDERAELVGTILDSPPLQDQYGDRPQAHATAVLGMWVFLATEVLFFGVLFLSVGIYRYRYPEAFEAGSERLNWVIGGSNTIVLLVSSLFMALAVQYAQRARRSALLASLGLTAGLGVLFLVLKGLEYYLDYRDHLIPFDWNFRPDEWVTRDGLRPDQVPHVKLFLTFYWVMTGLHGLHVLIGIGAVLTMLTLAWHGTFTPDYYSPVDVTALYWHFVDTVWIFLLPMLYLLGTHTLGR